jgi:hypothetical protein
MRDVFESSFLGILSQKPPNSSNDARNEEIPENPTADDVHIGLDSFMDCRNRVGRNNFVLSIDRGYESNHIDKNRRNYLKRSTCEFIRVAHYPRFCKSLVSSIQGQAHLLEPFLGYFLEPVFDCLDLR